jgi:TolB-like protein
LRSDPEPHSFDDTPILRRRLVAVLPFASVDGGTPLRLLGEDIADTLREQLARSPQLSTILISSAFLERAPEHALELVCRQLRVGYLVTGRCYPCGAGASLYVELTDTRDWKIHWARFFRGNAHELLAPASPAMASLQSCLATAAAHCAMPAPH